MTSRPAPGHPAGRLIAFADAIVAIAVTLLAIPLIDLAPDAARDPAAVWAEAWQPLLGFTISFFVIARLWWAQHRMFEHLQRVSDVLVRELFGWLFSVVLLSAVTATVTTYDPVDRRWPFLVYVGVMIVSSVLLLAQGIEVMRRPELTDGDDPDALARVVSSAETTVGFVLALVIGVLLPQVNYFALLVLVVTGRLDAPVLRFLTARRTRRVRDGRARDGR